MNLRRNSKKKQPLNTRQPSLMAGQDEYTFRRSRTLTGSLSSSVRTIAEDRTHLKSPRLKLHELQRHQRGIMIALGLSVIAVVVLGWLVSQFIRLPNDFTYAQTLNAQPQTTEYRTAIEEYFASRPTERFLFRMDNQQLTQFVARKHAEVEKVSVTSIGPGVFDVEIDLRQPILAWRSGDTQLYVDKNGVAFRKNHFTEPAVVVDDQSGIQLDNSNVVASSRFIEFLGRIVGGVDSSGLKVEKIIIPTGTTREVDLVIASHPFPIKTHIDREPTAQAQDVVSAVSYIDSKGITPEYIDVRIPGKAFYR